MSTLLTQCPECGGTLCLSRNAVTCGGCGWSRPAAVYLRWLCQEVIQEISRWDYAVACWKLSEAEMLPETVKFSTRDRVETLGTYTADFRAIYRQYQFPDSARHVLNEVQAAYNDVWRILIAASNPGGDEPDVVTLNTVLPVVFLQIAARPRRDWNKIAAGLDSDLRAAIDESPPLPLLRFADNDSAVWIGDKCIPVTPDQAMFLREVAANRPTTAARPDRLRKRLPAEIQCVIGHSPGRGHWIDTTKVRVA